MTVGTNSCEIFATADSEPVTFNWLPVIVLYSIYIGLIVAGDLARVQGASSAGAAVILLSLYGCYGRYLLRVRLDLVLFCLLLSMFIPLIPMVSMDAASVARTTLDLIKYYALNFLILLALCIPFGPLARARWAWILYLLIVAFLLSGWMLAPAQSMRVNSLNPTLGIKGFLVNGNNFALMAMSLLFLADDERMGALRKLLHFTLVFSLICLSHTSGALLAFFVGLLYRFLFRSGGAFKPSRWLIIGVGLTFTFLVFTAMPPNTLRLVDSTKAKIDVTLINLDRVLAGKKIDYYEMIIKKKENVTSGLWRLSHWNGVITAFSESSFDKILFGHGIGATKLKFGIEAHNDYLRFLYQTGVIGLICNLFIWWAIYRRMAEEYRWGVVMIAFYCFTENNYDNFFVMSMLALHMISAHKTGLTTKSETEQLSKKISSKVWQAEIPGAV